MDRYVYHYIVWQMPVLLQGLWNNIKETLIKNSPKILILRLIQSINTLWIAVPIF